MHVKRDSLAIIRAVTTLANALSVPVCVEGIENEAAFDRFWRKGSTSGGSGIGLAIVAMSTVSFWSLGAAIGMQVALLAPDRVERPCSRLVIG